MKEANSRILALPHIKQGSPQYPVNVFENTLAIYNVHGTENRLFVTASDYALT